ncbi:MAG: RHS repeat-associated core domain-containing protein [Janthinobacterium lividum]
MKPRIGRRYLLQCDSRQSVLSNSAGLSLAYSCFGWCAHDNGSRIAFNGRFKELHGGYLLGNGYRLYSSVLGRFVSPDSLSPFDQGGMNAYVYCHSDPLNAIDPTGHIPVKPLLSSFDGAGNFLRRFWGGLPDFSSALSRGRGSSASGLKKVSSFAGEGFAFVGGAAKPEMPYRSGNVMRALNSTEGWMPRRAELLAIDFDLNVPKLKALDKKELLARQAQVETGLAGMFPGYDYRSGLALQSAAEQKRMFVSDTRFSRRILFEELRRMGTLPTNMRNIRAEYL